MSRSLLLLILLVSAREVFSARILAAMPTFGKSHHFVFMPYLEGLAKAGHEIVHMTYMLGQKPIANISELDMSHTFTIDELVGDNTIDTVRKKVSPLLGTFFVSSMGKIACENILRDPQSKNLIESDEHFDLVITESFNAECLNAFAYKFKAPLIMFSSAGIMPWHTDSQGNPQNPSYMPTMMLSYVNPMNFFQRLINSVFLVYFKITYRLASDIGQEAIARKYFGSSLPPLSEITGNASLLLLNSHFSIAGALPLVPGTVEVGGIHIRPPKKLPQDIQKFLDDSKDGVVYFSMGSYLRSETFSEEKRKAFLDAFAEIPQRVLWKFEQDSLPGQPKNVKIKKWLPQTDVLAHPNVRAFMSHGGLGGTTEAVYNGVPLIGIPIMADQNVNIKNVAKEGMAVELDYENITKDSVLAALKTVLNNPSYKENAKRMSQVFKDRPLPPLETALYWTEYVLRHRGAPQLRCAAADLTWYQYFLIDVAAVLLAVIVVIALVVRKLILLCCRRKTTVVSPKKKAN